VRAKLPWQTTGPQEGTRRVRAAALAAGALAALLAACASKPPPPPDTDATPETAHSLGLGAPHLDALQCEDETGPDCVDWFRFRPTGPGTLRVLVAMDVAEGEKPPATTPPFELAVTDEAGADLGRAVSSAETPIATVSLDVREPKAYLASVRLPSGGKRQAYRLGFEAQLRTAPPPATKSRRWTVLEVDRGGAAGTSVLIDGGRADALAPGQRGRLVEGGRTLGRVVVTEVFEEGARARVEGALSGTITAETVAEIEVPADTR
jgi:hypothetical protein